ncbi:MAG: Gfo/Idh/MocA family oxidoreductase [Lachnospiraceae bacterium]|nr:Gfo/Idh/MocA family oxidoreductase [Lachnospiraceae bacterium]
MEKIRLGLVGCGKMMTTHAVGVNSISDQLEITAVCDINLENAEDMAAALKNHPYVTTDYRTMLDYVDAVLIALPHDLHYECGMFFAWNKKHILMEKPLCNTEEECLSLITTCEQENVVLMCAYPVRFFPGVQKLKELVDSGNFGRIIQMSIWTEQLTTAKPEHYMRWNATARLGGGQFFSHGCHYVDILLWFLGNPVKGSHLGTRVGTPWILKEGTSTAIMQFENGALGYHGATWGARGSKLRVDYQIQTEKGMLEYDRMDDSIKLYDSHTEHVPGVIESNDEYKVLWRGDIVKKGEMPTKHTQYEILHFIDCVKTGKRPITDGRAALQSLRVIWAMYAAEKNNVIADLRGLGLDQYDPTETLPYQFYKE